MGHSLTVLEGQRPVLEVLGAWGGYSSLGKVGRHVGEAVRAVERYIDVCERVLVEPFSKREVLKVGPLDVVVDEHMEYMLETAIDSLFVPKHSEALNVWALLDDPLEPLLLYLSKLLIDIDICVVKDCRRFFLLLSRVSLL